MKKITAEQLADKIIKEMTKEGFTPEQMLEIIRLAKEKYLQLQNGSNS
jgi:hypothetical protein